MHFLIIGGSGFIGTHLCKNLSLCGQHTYQILDKNIPLSNHCDYIISDLLRMPLGVNFKKPDFIINLAAEHTDNVTPIESYYNVNVDGASIVCNLADSLGCSNILFTSSVAVYGDSDNVSTELTKPAPSSHYGKSKLLAEDVYRSWFLSNPSERSLSIIRPTVVFGPLNRGNFYKLLKQLSSGKFLMVGNGANKKSIAYVENLTSYIIFCIANKKGYFLSNYVDKPDLTMSQIITLLNKILGKSNRFKIIVPYHIAILVGYFFDLLSYILSKNYSISSLRIKKFLRNTFFSSSVLPVSGFSPPFTIEDGMRKTIEHEFVSRE